jgi:hypothetical protein
MQLDIEKSIRRDLSKKGYFIALFEAEEDEPAFAYTIGLYDNYEHPEIVIFGLDLETMTIMLSDACERVKLEETFVVKQDYEDFLEGYKLTFQHANVDEYKGLFSYGIDNNQGVEFPMIQMIWPDQKHNYPWDDDFDENLLPRQPLLV